MKQLDLFQPTLSTTIRDVKSAMNHAIRESGRSRDQVLDSMNEMAARHGIRLNGRAGLSKDTLEKWLAPDDETRIPTIKGLTVFCAVLGTLEPFAVMIGLLGGEVIGGKDITLLKWARGYQQTKNLRKEMRRLEDEL